MQPQDWLEELRAELPSTAPEVTDDEVEVLLDLARAAAHTSERWTAPISTFMAGVALADLSPDHRAARIRELTGRLEQELQDVDGGGHEPPR